MHYASTLDNIVEPCGEYRSKSEAKVANVLKRNYPLVEYEKPLFLMDRGSERCWRPDFSLTTDFINELIVEYAGLIEFDDYAKGIRHKANTYAKNELQAVFLYPDELYSENYVDRIRHKILEATIRFYEYIDNPPANPRRCRTARPDFSI